MNFNKVLNSIKKGPENLLKACNPNKSAGKTLLVINALGMLFAAASDTFAAAVDRNTSSEDKKFLIPAGVATGVAKIGIYFAMTKKIIEKLETAAVDLVGGKKTIKNVVEKDGKKVKESVEQLVDESTMRLDAETLKTNAFNFVKNKIEKVKKAELKPDMKKLLLSADEKTVTQKGIELYQSNVKAAAGVLGAFTGAVVGCALLTPILRDVSAYFVQKLMEKKNPTLKNEPYRPYFQLSKVDSRCGKQPLSLKNYMSASSSNMRI